MSQLETIKIKHEAGFGIINKDDFDPAIHELFDAPTEGKRGASKKAIADKGDASDGKDTPGITATDP